MSSPQPHPTRQVLANRDVRSFVVARYFSGTSHALIHAALGWHLFQLTQSSFQLGLRGLIEFLPVIPISLIAGVIADGRDRRKLVLAAQAVSMAMIVVLTLSVGGENETLVLYLAAFSLAAASSFENPANSAILPAIVPREIYQNAAVLSSAIRNFARISGPVAMGFVTEWAGIAATYTLAAVLYGLSMTSLLFLRSPEVASNPPDVSLRSIQEGLSFVWNRKPVLGSMTLDMFAVIFAGATALLPVYAEEILQVGPRGYGLLSSAMAIGTFSMTLFLLTRHPFARPGRALLVAVAFFGAATVVFGLSRWFPLSFAAFVVAGMADQVSMTVRSVIIQLSTPDSLRGRVNSVNMIFIGASNELGEAESGFLAALTSATFSVVGGGIACLAVLGLVAWRMPQLAAYRPSLVEDEAG